MSPTTNGWSDDPEDEREALEAWEGTQPTSYVRPPTDGNGQQLDEGALRELARWIATRPPAVQARIREYPPGAYRYAPTHQKVWLYSYESKPDGTCSEVIVLVKRGENPHSGAWQVPSLGNAAGHLVGPVPLTHLTPWEATPKPN